ncbi:MAG: hypothetical protein AAF670_07355 [Planctomycetota bacterium]
MTMGVIGEGQPAFEAFLNFGNTFDSVGFGVTEFAIGLVVVGLLASQ